MAMEKKRVKDMYVQCALRVRNFDASALAMSDCCQKPATNVVEMSNGRRMFRCEEHRGIRAIGPSDDYVFEQVPERSRSW